MLDKEIINHMDVEELRNYVVHQAKVISALQTVNSENADIIERMEMTIHAMNCKYGSLSVYNARFYELSSVERELRQKYERYLTATPVCSAHSVSITGS